MRTDFQTEIIRIAYLVLDEHDAGRSVDPMRLQWAQAILLANASEPAHQSRAQAK